MVLGITGGIGAGKSTILNLLKEEYQFVIFETDIIAKEIMEPGNLVFNRIVAYFGNDILNPDGQLDRKKMASIVFHDKSKLQTLNEIVHPGVIEEVSKRIKHMSASGKERFVIESALLIESGCYKICDKVWYIDTNPAVRRERLKHSRNMTDEQIDDVIKNQLKKEDCMSYSDEVIDNSGDINSTKAQIEKILVFSYAL